MLMEASLADPPHRNEHICKPTHTFGVSRSPEEVRGSLLAAQVAASRLIMILVKNPPDDNFWAREDDMRNVRPSQ